MSDRGRHWDDAYRINGVEAVSWYQPEPVMSLELIRLLDVEPFEPVIDVGGGALCWWTAWWSPGSATSACSTCPKSLLTSADGG
jgi:hypothetical protein